MLIKKDFQKKARTIIICEIRLRCLEIIVKLLNFSLNVTKGKLTFQHLRKIIKYFLFFLLFKSKSEIEMSVIVRFMSAFKRNWIAIHPFRILPACPTYEGGLKSS